MTREPVTVLIADDHALAREAVRSVLAADDGFVVVGEARDAEEAFAATERLRPRLVLMDIRMPGDGIKATRRIKAVFPDVHVVMITVSDDAQHLFEAVRAGAQGYLLKNLAPEKWTEYLHSVVDGEAPLSGTLARQILSEMAGAGARPAGERPAPDLLTMEPGASGPGTSGAGTSGPGSSGSRSSGSRSSGSRSSGPGTSEITASEFRTSDALPFESLTPRETDVLELVAKGLTNREIARRLSIAENTVKNHLKNMLAKWHVDNRTQLVRLAFERGVLK